ARPATANAPAPVARTTATAEPVRSIPAPTEQSRPTDAAPGSGLTIDDIVRQAGGASTSPGRNDPLP
ncbi:MAG TPA: hypothetical protein VIP82_04365, partial [Microbacterium sp.]